ncbi:maleylpyruvate isomerase family mycothiol-dependent enzyme, partial [Paractinoplanes abujensis]|uniref:maleylpyruvate isomerase family mycothiol-dependent enzyme n=1 Tax=Paractinoplanes abujensis TaxID=882441 RepID=UPI0027E5575F
TSAGGRGRTVIYELTTENRRRIADLLEGLDDEQWAAPTLCEGWTVRDLAAHFVQPMLVSFGQFFLVSIRYRGDTARTVDHFTRRLARRPRAELIALLREHAGDHVDPPRVGPMGPFAETCVHLRDIARPLGLTADVPAEHWRLLLDYLVSAGAAPGLVPPGRLDGLRLSDPATGWSSGDGDLVEGPLEALAMAATGRRAALNDLRGPGVAKLQTIHQAGPR